MDGVGVVGIPACGIPKSPHGATAKYFNARPLALVYSAINDFLFFRTCKRTHLVALLPRFFTPWSSVMLGHVASVVAIFAQLALCARKAPASNSRAVKAARVPAGFSNCIFYDDFCDSEGSLPDASRWAVDLGTQYDGGPAQWGTGEVETYTDDWQNGRITADCTLKMTAGARRRRLVDLVARRDDGRLGLCLRGRRAPPRRGRIRLGDNPEARSLGIWPAFWALAPTTAATTRTGRPWGRLTYSRASTASAGSGTPPTAARTRAARATSQAALPASPTRTSAGPGTRLPGRLTGRAGARSP
ncbi:hypothetical protein J3459_009954 [Metarhizium acridum]|nr:hypothetical protein J3459_009954 [Metarhizium acridum]